MEVKGTAVASFAKFVEEKFGCDAYQNWLQSLNQEGQHIYGQTILASKWYSLNDSLVEHTRSLC